MKDLGAPRHLQTLIEGESLFNDGTAIVVFTVFYDMTMGGTYTGGEVVLMFIRLSIGGPILGWTVGEICEMLMFRLDEKDYVSEVIVTTVAAYGTYILAQQTPLQVNGVLALICLGLKLSSVGTMHAIEAMHQWWGIISWVLNTLVFFVVGAIFVEKVWYNNNPATLQDWLNLIYLYLALHVIRILGIIFCLPLLQRFGYGLTFKEGIILAYSGLRGGVGLMLGLVIELSLDLPNQVRQTMLFHMAGIAALTILINGTTCGMLIEYLGLTKPSESKITFFDRAVSYILAEIEASLEVLKQSEWHGDADWTSIWNYFPVLSLKAFKRRLFEIIEKENKSLSEIALANMIASYEEKKEHRRRDVILECCKKDRSGGKNNKRTKITSSTSSRNVNSRRFSDGNLQTSELKISIPSLNEVNLTEKDKEQLLYNARYRYLNLLKSNYWKQYETGLLSHAGLIELLEVCSTQQDNITHPLEQWKMLQPACHLPWHVKILNEIPFMRPLYLRLLNDRIAHAWDMGKVLYSKSFL